MNCVCSFDLPDMYKEPPANLDDTFLALPIISVLDPEESRGWGNAHTLHGLFNSNPGGAAGLSVCPLRYPVNLRSRSITV